MGTNKGNTHPRQTLLLVAFLILGGAPAGRGQDPPAPSLAKEHPEKTPEYKEFLDRVQAFVSLRKSIESGLPALKPTDLPEMITAHQQALARKIREGRANAKPGDIFTENAAKAFRRTAGEELRGPHGKGARATMRQGEPLKEIQLQVNEPYPDGVSFTTVPPSLLRKFPKLPDHLAYRIAGRDLILLDVEANLVIDKISDIIP
jgi:hypothetical protein